MEVTEAFTLTYNIMFLFKTTFNPIIYTAFNKRFRQNFFEILTGKKKIPTGKKKTKRKPVISIRI